MGARSRGQRNTHLAQVDHALDLMVRAEAAAALGREVERRRLPRPNQVQPSVLIHVQLAHTSSLAKAPQFIRTRSSPLSKLVPPATHYLTTSLRPTLSPTYNSTQRCAALKAAPQHWAACGTTASREGSHCDSKGIGQHPTLWQPSCSQRLLATSTMPLDLCCPQYCAGAPAHAAFHAWTPRAPASP